MLLSTNLRPNISKKLATFLNPGQTPIDTCDQPVTKSNGFSNEFGPDACFSIFGEHNIEESVLFIHRKLIKGSGPHKICGRQPLKKLKFFKGCLPQISLVQS